MVTVVCTGVLNGNLLELGRDRLRWRRFDVRVGMDYGSLLGLLLGLGLLLLLRRDMMGWMLLLLWLLLLWTCSRRLRMSL